MTCMAWDKEPQQTLKGRGHPQLKRNAEEADTQRDRSCQKIQRPNDGAGLEHRSPCPHDPASPTAVPRLLGLRSPSSSETGEQRALRPHSGAPGPPPCAPHGRAPGRPGQPRRSPPVALLLQQAPEGLQVPHIGCVMEPRVLAVLQRVVTELLPEPLLQIRTCTEERGSCQLPETLPTPTRRGRHLQGPLPPELWKLPSSEKYTKFPLMKVSTFLTPKNNF